MKHIYILTLLLALVAPTVVAQQKTTREERSHIASGNTLYKKGDYSGAKKEYDAALGINGSNITARYNKALSQIRMAGTKNQPEKSEQLLKDAMTDLSAVSAASSENPSLASKAAYNMGNMAFNQQDYTGAISHYKDALRLDPENEKTRRNLRIAQKKLQQNNNNNNNNNNQNQNQNQNKDNQNNQDNKDNQQDKNKDDKKQNEQTNQDKIDKQNAERILNAVENKENATRARMQGDKNNKNNRRNQPVKNW